MRPPYDSLRFRLIAAAIIGALAGLVTAGAIITEVFHDNLKDQFRQDLVVHLAELSAIAQTAEDGSPRLRQPLPDPRFQAFGEHYWQIEREGYPPARSPSLAGHTLSGRFAVNSMPKGGEAEGPRGAAMEYGRTLATEDGGPPLRLSLASDMSVLVTLLNNSNHMLLLALLVIGAVLVGGSALQLTYGLSPLTRLGRTIAEMRRGGGVPNGDAFPSEIRPLIQDLGALLDANAQIVQRARIQAGALAHGLRTPLAIVMDEAEQLERAGQTEAAGSLMEQCQRMQQQIDYHIARSRAVGAVRTPGRITPVPSALQPILSAMARLHGARGVIFQTLDGAGLSLACDPEDFAEIASALIDNAGKWALASVQISWAIQDDSALLFVDDDGPGLAADLRERVFAVGERLDDTVAGSGLGLTIARDLAQLYGGAVDLADAPGTGLRVVIRLPLADLS